MFVWWAAEQGGFATTRSYPGAVLVLGALLVLVLARPGSLAGAPRLVQAALGCAVLFGGLALLSALWAEAPADAWHGANRTLLYIACFGLFALTPLRGASLATVLGLFSSGIATVGIVTLARAASGIDPGRIFVDNRLSQPIGYVNATCALFLMALLPAAVLASRRELPIAARGLLFGVSFCLVELAVLCQSRASLGALPISLLIAFVLVRQRTRLFLALSLIGGVAGLTLPRLLAVYEAAGAEAERDAAEGALWAIGMGSFAIVLTGLAVAWVDRRIRVARATARRAERVLGLTAAVVMLALASLALATSGNPVDRAQAAWDEFNSGYPETFEGSHFAGGLGDYRADYWRVALGQFRDAPLLGVGADNFAAAYVEERRFDNETRFPHSAPLAILASHGLVGMALLVGFIGCALASFVRRSRVGAAGMPIESAALLVFVYWAVHGSVDWFWEIPGLAAPAFAFLGAAAGASQHGRSAAGRPARDRLLVAAAVAVAFLAATPPWLAARQVQHATSAWPREPDASLDGLDVASRLNPLSEQADLLAGAIANRTGRAEQARTVLLRAVARNPVNWYAHLELAIAEASLERRENALQALSRAAELNRREDVIQLVHDWIEKDDPVDLVAVDGIFRERVASRTR